MALLAARWRAFNGQKRLTAFPGRAFPISAPFLESLQTNGPETSPLANLCRWTRRLAHLRQSCRSIFSRSHKSHLLRSEITRPAHPAMDSFGPGHPLCSGAAQLPGESASFALAGVTTRLGNCDTEMMQTAPARFVFCAPVRHRVQCCRTASAGGLAGITRFPSWHIFSEGARGGPAALSVGKGIARGLQDSLATTFLLCDPAALH